MKFRQLIVTSIIYMLAFSAQAAFVAGMASAQIRPEIAAQQAAGGDVAAIVSIAAAATTAVPQVAATVTVAVQNAAATAPAPSFVLTPPPLSTPTTRAVCSVSCS